MMTMYPGKAFKDVLNKAIVEYVLFDLCFNKLGFRASIII